MKNRLAYKLLSLLNKAQIKKCQVFLQMEYPKDTYLHQLFETLILPASSELDPLAIHEQSAYKEPYTKKKFENKLSHLTSAIKDFMAVQHLLTKGESFERKKATAAFLMTKKQTDLFYLANKEAQEKIKASTFPINHWQAYQIRHQKYYFPSYNRQSKKESDDLYEEIQFHFDAFLIAIKLKNLLEAKSREKIRAYSHSKHLMEPIKELALQTPFRDLPSIVPMIYFIELLDKPDNENYQKVYREIIPLLRKEKTADVLMIFSNLINQTAFLYNLGLTDFRRKTLDLYQIAIEEKILQGPDGFISKAHFTNAIILASNDGRTSIQWARQMLTQIDESIRADQVENTKMIAEAFILFGEKKFLECDDLSREIQPADIEETMKLKTLHLRCIHELKRSGSAYQHLEMIPQIKAFEVFLRQQKLISSNMKIQNLNFCKFLRKLNSKKTIDPLKIKEQLVGTSSLILRPWLIEKLEELEQ